MKSKKIEETRERLRLRVIHLGVQLDELMTPALRKELRHVLDKHSTTLEHPDFGSDSDAIDNLDNLYNQLSVHWVRVHKNFTYYSSLKEQMARYQEFLTEALCQDYLTWEKPFVPSVHQLQLADRVEQSKSTKNNDAKFRDLYREQIVIPLKEMALNQAHVEHRLLLAKSGPAQQREHSNSHVQCLINQCNWQSLAKMLLNDRDLARNLENKFFDEETRESIQRKIDEIEVEYFEVLKSPADYIINERAMDLQSRRKLGYYLSERSSAKKPGPSPTKKNKKETAPMPMDTKED